MHKFLAIKYFFPSMSISIGKGELKTKLGKPRICKLQVQKHGKEVEKQSEEEKMEKVMERS